MSSQPNGAHEVFGPYRVHERVGLGDVATVHRATRPGVAGPEQVAALKRMLPHLAADDGFARAFVREGKLAALLRHTNIAQLYEVGRVGATYFIAMEYVEGHDLRAILRYADEVGEPPPLDVALALAIQLCDALDYAHRRSDDATAAPLGIVHRDLSPPNLLVEHTGQLKVIDFGLAKAASEQHRPDLGPRRDKLAYRSPEAAAGLRLDGRSDVFCAGIVLHELLTGRPLFAADTDAETLERVRGAAVEPPSVRNPACSPAVDAIVLRALERERSLRLPSAAAMREALAAAASQEQLTATSQKVAAWMARALGRRTGFERALAPHSRRGAGRHAPHGDALDPSGRDAVVVAQDSGDDGGATTLTTLAPGEIAAAAGARRRRRTPRTATLPLGGAAAAPRPALAAARPPLPASALSPRTPDRPRRPRAWAKGTTAPPLVAEVAAAVEPPPAPRGYARAALAGALAGVLITSGAFVLQRTASRPPPPAPAPAPATSLTLAIAPAGAVVTIDAGDEAGEGTLALAPGRHRVVVSHPGYRSYVLELSLDAGARVARRIELSARTDDPRAKLILRDGPAELTLVVDGRRLPAPPPVATWVEPGPRRVELRQRGSVVRAILVSAEAHTDYEL